MKYVLDVSKWICGGSEGTDRNEGCHVGSGGTFLLNPQGYMCCLGQFALQQGVNPEDLLRVMDPGDLVNRNGQKPYDMNFLEEDQIGSSKVYNNNQLAHRLMDINDNRETTIKTKIELIRDFLEDAGHELEVLNGDQYEA